MALVLVSTVVGELLRGTRRPARVVVALPAAVYLEVHGEREVHGDREAAGRWVAVLTREAVRVPIGLVTALRREEHPFRDVAVGSTAVIGDGGLRLRGELGFRPVRYWDPSVPRLLRGLDPELVGRRADALALDGALGVDGDRRVDGDRLGDGIHRWPERVGPLASALTPSSPCAERVAEAARALVGLGPGLTPAGDDVLAGALAALAAAGDEPRRARLAEAVRPLLPRTSPISAALLDQARLGRAIPQVVTLLRALAGSGELEAASSGLLAVGHTSGAALALGVRAALAARATGSLRRCA
jgi:Protein of unknown function (DUF2877)